MKVTSIFALALALPLTVSGLGAAAAEGGNGPSGKAESLKIRLVFQQQEVLVDMFDTPASRDFLSLLPLTLEFSDYVGTEKIATLPRRLNTKGALAPHEATGDFTYYAPWGNLAVFYKGFGRDKNLAVLGRIQSGKETLAAQSRPFTAKIEQVE